MRDFVKGRTADEKFKSISTTLKHFSRRLSKKVVGLIPAAPIIKFVVPGEGGAILNMICPVDGKITQGCVYIDSSDKLVSLGLRLRRGGRTEEDTYNMKTNVSLPFSFDTEVRLGDMITLWVEEPEVDGLRVNRVKSVWLGFLYEISLKGLGKVDFVLNQIEKMIEEDCDAGQT